MKGIILHVIKSSIRDFVFLGIGLINLFAILFSIFLGSNALVESYEAIISYSTFMTRISTISGFTIFISFYFKKIFDNKEIDIFLSKSISRKKAVFAFFIGIASLFIPFFLIGFIVLIIAGIKLNLAFIWCLSLLCEAFAVISVAIFFNLMLNSKINALIFTLMFYIVAKMIGGFIPYIQFSFSFSFNNILAMTLKVISIFIPRFDLLAQSDFLLNYKVNYYNFFLGSLQSVIFSLFTMFIAIFDFNKKEL